jgi:chromate reductase
MGRPELRSGPVDLVADSLRLVGFAGSLRRDSFNQALLSAARELAPTGTIIDLITIGQLPLYTADVEAEGDPPSVAEFKGAIREADGVLIATPEHNGGIPGFSPTQSTGPRDFPAVRR